MVRAIFATIVTVSGQDLFLAKKTALPQKEEVNATAACTFATLPAINADECSGKFRRQGFSQMCFAGGKCTMGSGCGWLAPPGEGFKCCFGSYTDPSCDWHSLLGDAPENASEVVANSTGAEDAVSIVKNEEQHASNVSSGASCTFATLPAINRDECSGKFRRQGFSQMCFSGGKCTMGSGCGWLAPPGQGFKCCFGSYTDPSCDWHSMLGDASNENVSKAVANSVGAEDAISVGKNETKHDSNVSSGASCTFATLPAINRDECSGKFRRQGFSQMCFSGGKCTMGSGCGWLAPPGQGFKCCFGSYTDPSCDWHSMLGSGEIDAKNVSKVDGEAIYA